jgi:hypothetical protein
MGNCRMEHCRSCVNIAPTILLEVIVVETRKQHVGIGVTQSLGVGITTIGVEMVATPK